MDVYVLDPSVTPAIEFPYLWSFLIIFLAVLFPHNPCQIILL